MAGNSASRLGNRFRPKSVQTLMAAALGALILFQGCATASRAAFCAHELPTLETGYENALIALSPWLEQRSLASEAGQAPVLLLPEVDRPYWGDWAEARLRAAQSAMDLEEVENRGGLRKELSQLADELVIFHGYSYAGRADRMASSIQKLQAISKRVQAKGCSELSFKKS